MKFSLLGLLQFRPFDESEDNMKSGDAYQASPAMCVLIVAGAIVSTACCVLAMLNHPATRYVLGVFIPIQALLAGCEWNTGMRARSLNTLFLAVCILAACQLFFYMDGVG